MNSDSESSPALESLPHVLADIGDTIDLDDALLWQRVTQRRRARRRRRAAVAGLGAAVVVAAVASTAIAFADRTGPSLRVGTSQAPAPRSTTTTFAPLPLQDLTLGPNCVAPEFPPKIAPWPTGLSMRFSPASTTLAPGEAVRGRIDLNNASNAPISVIRNWARAFAASGHTLVGADALAPGQPIPLAIGLSLSVPAHGHGSTDVSLTMAPCGVGIKAFQPLPPGHYEIYVTLPSASDGRYVLVAPPVRVIIKPAGRVYGTMTLTQVTVPDLEGMDRTSLATTLRALGLTDVSATAKSKAVPRGAVISQDPPAGTHLRVGTVVHVIISSGP